MTARGCRPALAAAGPALLVLLVAGAAVAAPASVPAPASVSASAPAPAEDGESARRTPVVRAVELALPAVVNLSTETLVRNPYYAGGSLFDRLFGLVPTEPRERHVTNSLGSGVIVDRRGYVITNEHVVATASRITVTLVDGRQVAADVVGTAGDYDLAVLALKEPGPYPHLSLAFDGPLHLGETVIAIGNPYGLQGTVTTGVLSATDRRLQSGGASYTDFLQTDAAINPGNSGGALLTVDGDLIGINAQVHARGQNLGFAIPVARVRKVFAELVEHGQVLPAWLGMEVEALEQDLAARLGVPERRGVLVRLVHADGPAAVAGVQAGDVVTEVDGQRVGDHAEYWTALARVRLGDPLELTTWRGSARRPVRLTARPLPGERGAELAWRHAGFAVEMARTARGRGVLAITRVRPRSRAEATGLHPGLAVLAIDGQAVATPEEFYRALASRLSRRSVLLVVGDARATYRVPLALE